MIKTGASKSGEYMLCENCVLQTQDTTVPIAMTVPLNILQGCVFLIHPLRFTSVYNFRKAVRDIL